MTSIVINNIKNRIFQQPFSVASSLIEGGPPPELFISGGPESSKIYGCSTCVVNSKIIPDRPASLSNSRTPIISVQSTPDSATTKRRNDNILSLTLSPGIINPEQRFSYVLPPVVPPPDIIAFIHYRSTNEPAARIPVCVGPKRFNTG